MFTILPLAMRADGHGPATYGAVSAINGLLIVVLSPLVSGRGCCAAARRPRLAAGTLLIGAAMLVVAGSDGLARLRRGGRAGHARRDRDAPTRPAA